MIKWLWVARLYVVSLKHCIVEVSYNVIELGSVRRRGGWVWEIGVVSPTPTLDEPNLITVVSSLSLTIPKVPRPATAQNTSKLP